MIKHGTLNTPVIGVARADWGIEELRERARKSLEERGGGVDKTAFDKLMNLLRYVGGDYHEDATFDALRKALGDAKHPTHYLATPPSMFATVGQGLGNREDGVEAAWRVVEPILGTVLPVIEYEPDTWGPKEADDLISSHGGWINPKAG